MIRLLCCVICAEIICAETGCVRRRIFVRSDPPGALLYVNKKPVGHTPITLSFTHYGEMEFMLSKDGYETLREIRKIRAPWYEWPGVDFFSEVVWPQKITDLKQLDFQMVPERNVSQSELLSRAESLRRESQAQTTLQVGSGNMNNPGIAPIMVPSQTPTVTPTVQSPSELQNGYYGGTTQPSGSIGVPVSPFTNNPTPPNIPFSTVSPSGY
ncbi:MAG: PEGA domain-containing protein [Planctomycetaceae bacterium]|nr:PEGA domain-containing protein [Planctomycetaceae bacterium]